MMLVCRQRHTSKRDAGKTVCFLDCRFVVSWAPVLAGAHSIARRMQNLELSKKEKVAVLLTSLGTGMKTPLTYIDAQRYIQHNQRIGKGLQGFKHYLKEWPRNAFVRIVRLMEDGDFVFAHVEYHFEIVMIGFSVFRFERDRIVEHWDNLQISSAEDNIRPSHACSVNITEHQRTVENKQIANCTVEDVLVKKGDNTVCSRYFKEQVKFQHYSCAWIRDQTIPPAIQYDKIHRVLGEGNFALVVSEGRQSDCGAAFYDLFRIENGKIAEHWNTTEEIVEMGTS